MASIISKHGDWVDKEFYIFLNLSQTASTDLLITLGKPGLSGQCNFRVYVIPWKISNVLPLTMSINTGSLVQYANCSMLFANW